MNRAYLRRSTPPNAERLQGTRSQGHQAPVAIDDVEDLDCRPTRRPDVPSLCWANEPA